MNMPAPADLRRSIGAAITLFLLGGFAVFLSKTPSPVPHIFLFILAQACYAGLVIAWGYSINRRIIQKDIRLCLTLSCLLMFLWIVERAAKYYLFSELPAFERMLWYCYYIFIVYVPLLGFLAALRVALARDRRDFRRWNLLFIPATLLLVGVLTNDRHQLAFRFQPGFADWNSNYAHEILYYAVLLWAIVLVLSGVALIARRSRVTASRRLVWIPLLLFAGGSMLTELSFLNLLSFWNITETIILTFILTWESCIQIGLVPSNRDYEAFFHHSGLATRLLDPRDRVRYRSTADAPAPAPENIRLNRREVSGGFIEWEDDLTQINRLNALLSEIQDQLNEKTELTRTENRMKEKRARVDEKNRLYDRIGQFSRPHLTRISAELEHLTPDQSDFTRRMAHICVIGSYVKRRSNFTLLSEKNPLLSSDELVFSLRESLEYLSLHSKNNALSVQSAGFYASEALICAYDFCQQAMEAQFQTPPMLLINLRCDKDGFSLRTVTEVPYPVNDACKAQIVALGGTLKREERDEVCYTTLRWGKGAQGE